jgi:uncharacterized protein GlcG (DUF336 family)
MSITLEQALKLITSARKEADKIGVPMVIAVVDAGGNLVAQQRMDGALLVSVDISLNKAYTAVAVQMSTHDLAVVAQPGKPLFGIHNADGARIVIFGGGLPLSTDQGIVGGVGVSGGSVEEDIRCAEAAVEQFRKLYK